MNVDEAKLPLSISSWSNGAWPRLAGRTRNAQGLTHQGLTQSADPPTADADGDELALPLVSPPPLIPRVFPGL
jgi:hypothetical protein